MNTQLALIKIDGLKATTIGIEKFPKSFSFGEGINGLKQLARGDSFLRWLIGDLVNYLMRNFCPRDAATGQFKDRQQSERAQQIFDATNLSASTLNNCSTVALAFPFSRRREKVSWSHHAELTALEPKDQESWLDQCETNGLSRLELRTRLAEATGDREARQPSLFAEFNPVKTVNELVRGLKMLDDSKPIEQWPLADARKLADQLDEPYVQLTSFRNRILTRLNA